MRKGLRNLSTNASSLAGLNQTTRILTKVSLGNTELMTTGAAFGAGIYLSPHASTSKGYARFGQVHTTPISVVLPFSGRW